MIASLKKKELYMKAYIMGNYTSKAFQGFLKDPTSDRKAVVEQLTKAMGGTMPVSYTHLTLPTIYSV